MLTIIAQDPSVDVNGDVLRARVEAAVEQIAPRTLGVSSRCCGLRFLHRRAVASQYPPLKSALDGEPFENASDGDLMSDPNFLAQNVYAIVMRILARFEFALGGG